MNVITNDKLRTTIALAALEQVLDPEIGLNVVDLGLIDQLDFDITGGKIYVTMTLTTQFCPMGEAISSAVKRVLGKSFPEMEATIELCFDPPWTHERISESGKAFLNL